MFETVVGTLLSKFLGDYVDVEGKNLEISVLRGHVVLENLKLKREALSRYQLPVSMQDGFIGKLILDIPWKSLGKQPVQVKIQNVYLIAKPTSPSDYDPELASKNALTAKRRKLEISEAIKAEEASLELKKEGKTQKKSYTQQLIDSATSLFNVEISNVHFRYEDDISNKNSSFSLGVTLESFVATTVKSASEFIQQFTAKMVNLALYWNANEPFISYRNVKEMQEKMNRMIFKKGSSYQQKHKYILKPLCGSMDLQLNKATKPDLDIPKLVISSVFQQITISLQEQQWKQILYFSDYFTLYARGLKFHHIRPSGAVAATEDPLRWWTFVIQGARQQVRNHRNAWKYERFVDYKQYRMMYIHAWRKKKFAKNVSDGVLSELESLENLLDYDDIITFRLLAEASHKLQIPIPGADFSAGSGGWFSWAWGSKPEEEKPIGRFTWEQWKRLYKEIDFMGEKKKNEARESIPEAYVHTKAELHLEAVSLSLLSGDSAESNKFVEVGLRGLDLNVAKRPASLLVISSISSASLNDFMTLPAEEGIIEMLSLNPHNDSASKSFLQLEFEQNPLDNSSDIRLAIRALQSLNITCSRQIIDQTSTFFSHGSSATQLKQVANENWAAVRKNASYQLQSALDHHKRIDLQVDVVAPTIIIPSSFRDDDAPVLVLELGTFSFSSKLDNAPQRGKEVIMSDDLSEEDFYDHFDLRMSNIRAAVFLRNQPQDTLESKDFEILPNFNILLSVGVCIIKQPNLPKLRFKADFPSFLALISPTKIQKLMAVLKAFGKSEAKKEISLNSSMEDIDTTSSKSVSKPKEAAIVWSKQMKATFLFGEVSVLFHTDKEDVILISLQNFELVAMKTTHDFSADLRLNNFFIEDKIQQQEQFKYIISSTIPAQQQAPKETTDLVSISYKNVPKDSPAFKVIENIVKLSFNRLDITINRETLVQVLQFTKECLASLETDSEAQQALSVVENPKELTSAEAIPENASDKKVTVLFKSETTVSQVSLNLLVDGEKFVYSALRGFVVNAEAYSNKEFKVNGTVGQITVQDLSKDTFWKEIVRIDDEKVLDFWFETINPQSADDTGKIIVTVEMSSIVCVYLTRFVRRIGNYFSEFSQMQKLLAATATKAKERAQQTANEITKVIIFDVSIANPKFIVPRSSESKEYMLANLGDITINNDILPEHNDNLVDSIKVSISSVSLITACFDNTGSAELVETPVIPNSSMKVIIKRPLTPDIKRTYPDFIVSVVIPEISLSVTETQAKLSFGILYGNLAEVPESTAKAIQEKFEDEIVSVAEDIAAQSAPPKDLLDQNEVKTSLEIHLDLQTISLEVLEDRDNLSSSLGRFSIHSLSLGMETKSDSSQYVTFDIKRILLTDTRPASLSVHKHILAPLSPDKDKSLLTTSYSRSSGGHQSVEVIISSPRILLLPDFIFALHNTYKRIMITANALKPKPVPEKINYNELPISKREKSVVFPAIDESLAAEELESPRTSRLKRKERHAKMQERTQKAVSKIKESVGLIAKVDILAPELCFIENATEETSRALVMKETFTIQFSILEGRQHAQISISDIQIYKTRLGCDEGLITILTPFSILLNYSNSPGVSLNAIVEIEPIHLALAYSDFRLIMNMRDLWTEAMKSTPQIPVELQEDQQTNEQHDKHQLSSYSPPTKEEEPEKESADVNHTEEYAKILFHKLSIVLLNDCNSGSSDEENFIQQPLLAFYFDEIVSTVSDWSNAMTGKLSLSQLRAFYFNDKLNTFEPMIEPWDCFANIGKEDDFQVKLGSHLPFNLNITKKFVETLTTSIEQWESDYSKKEDKQRQSLHPYYIHNETGAVLTYWMTNSQHKHRVNNNSSIPLVVHNIQAPQQNRFAFQIDTKDMKQDTSVPMLSFQMEDYDVVPLHNLLFHKQVSYLFQDISSRNKNLRLLYKVRNDRGSKLISVGSDIVIVNDTSIPLQVQVESANTEAFYLDPIVPNSRVCLPVRHSADSKIKLRPFDLAYEWSQESIRCTPTMKERIEPFFTCLPTDRKNKESPHWLYSIEKRGTRSSKLGLSFDDDQEVEIHISAPFKLENTLPTKISYMIKNPAGANLTSGTLAIGAVAEIHQVLSDHRPMLHLRLADFGWSEGTKVGPTKKHSVRLFNKQGDAVKVQLQAEQTLLGARSCTIYSNFWIINQTGTKLYYMEPAGRSKQTNVLKSESGVVTSTEFASNLSELDINEDALVDETIFAKPVIYSEKQLVIRSNHTVWSNVIFLQQNGGVVNLPEKQSSAIGKGTPAACQYGVLVKSAPGKFWRSAVVYVRPYCILVNKFSMPLSFQQHNVPASRVDVNPGQQVPFHWFEYKSAHHLQVNVKGDRDWSSPFFMDAAASFRLPLHIQENPDESSTQIRVKINASLTSVVATFWPTQQDEADYIINNESEFHLLIGQDGTKESIGVKAQSQVPYCWCVPLVSKKKLRVAVSHTKVFLSANLDKLRSFKPLQWTGSHGHNNYLDIEVTADGLTKILNIRDGNTAAFNLADLAEAQQLSFRDLSAVSLIPRAQPSADTTKRTVTRPTMTIGLDLSSIALSLIDEKPQELILLTIEGLQVLYCMGDEDQSIQLQLQTLQIDNQLFSTPFPIMLHSRPIPNQPFFQMSMLRSTRYSHLRYIPYFAVKFQEMDLKVEESCLLLLLRFAESITEYQNARKIQEAEQQLFLQSPTYEVDAMSLEPHEGTALFFELFHINPVRVNLSFSTTGARTEAINQTMLEKSLRAGGFLANIDCAPLRLNGLILENPMCTQQELVSRITKHYTLQLMAETYKILGSIDILGSPVSLVNNLGTGVYDFFHEPVEGTVSNPREFAAGVARGTESLVKNTVFGVFNSASKISGSISKAATTISMDDDWQHSRAKKFRNKPSDVGEGISSGIKRLGIGIFDGVTGVVSQPIKGLTEDGGKGLARGVGKGISGLVLRPVVGFVDLITDTTEGIKNAAYSEYVKDRMRAPRYIGKNRILLPYDTKKSTLQFLLRTTEDGRFENHFFLDSWPISGNVFILLSDRRLFSFTSTATVPKKNWSIPILEIKDINLVDHGVSILLSNAKTLAFEAGQQTSKSIKTAVWKLLKRQKTSPIKQLEYHLIEDKAIVKREVKETREALVATPQHDPNLSTSSFLNTSTESLSNMAAATPERSTERSPLIPSGSRKLPKQKKEERCCSACSLM